MKKNLLFCSILLLAFSQSFSAEQKLILVEQMTTSSNNSPDLLPLANQFNNIVNSNVEVIPMTIHMNVNPDLFWEQRKDLDDRILLYKSTFSLPTLYVNGSEVVGMNNLQNKINSEKGQFVPIKMKVQKGLVTDNFLFVEVKMDLETPVDKSDLLFCAIIERHVVAPQVGNTSESDYYYVTRKIDLNPMRGEQIDRNDLGFSGNRFAFEIEKFWNMDEIYAIAWVQNTLTKKVSQAEKNKIYNEKPIIAVNKDSVNFDESNKNEVESIELYNNSMNIIDISSIQLDSKDNFSLQHFESETRIYPGMTKLLSVKLLNQEVGEYSTFVTIKSNATNTPELVIPINGKVESSDNPIITTDVTALDFGKVSKSQKEIVNITNTGKGTLRISSVEIMDNDEGVFTILNNEIPDVPEKGNLSLEVNFKPKEEINYFSTMVINTNATNESSYSITLRGEGDNLQQFSSIQVATEAVDFGTTDFIEPVRKSVVINNIGNIELELKNSAIDDQMDGVFKFVGEYNKTIAAESQDSIVLEFLPKYNKEYTTKLIIRSNNTDPALRRIEVPITGMGDGVSSVESFIRDFNVNYYNQNLKIDNGNESVSMIEIAFYDLNGNMLNKQSSNIGIGNVQIATNVLSRNQVIIYNITSNGKIISAGKFINN
ncbi:MAG: choice-of-anchor D domain-containing protein [Candidatus Kapaibacterium sp.]